MNACPAATPNPKPRNTVIHAAIVSLLCAGPALAAPGDRIGGRIAVDDSLSSPAIASNSAGELLLAWRPFATGLLQARRLDADGVAAGPAFLVASGALSERPPSVAMNASGDFVVAWTTARTQVFPLLVGAVMRPGKVFARRYAAGGVPLGEAFEVAAEGDEVDVAIDDDGDFALAWAVDGNNGRAGLFVPLGYLPIVDLDLPFAGIDRVQARRYSADGRAFPPITLDRQAEVLGREASGVSIAMDADGDHAVVWSRRISRERSQIVAQRFRADGTPDGRELSVNGQPVTGRDRISSPDAALSPNGDLAVTWEPDLSFARQLSARIAVFAPDNRPRVAEFASGPDGGVLSARPKIAIDALGNLGLSAGTRASALPVLQARFFTATGLPLTAPLQVLPAPATTLPEFSGITIDGAGRAAIAHVFLSGTNSGSGIGVQRFQAR